jgi:hypothetical protein
MREFMAVTLVTCRACKTKIDRDLAFKVGERSYYCTEKEYLSYLTEKEEKNKKTTTPKKKTKKDVLNLVFELFGYEVTNSALSNELRALSKLYTYDGIYSYIKDNYKFLDKIINGKDFEKEYGKIRYFTAIIKNNIVDYLNLQKEKIDEQQYIQNIEYDIPDVKYKTKHKRRALYDIEMELTEEDE